MQTVSNVFEQELIKRLNARIEALSLGLAAGTCQSFEEYKYRAGNIAGLRDVIELCDEVQTDMAKR